MKAVISGGASSQPRWSGITLVILELLPTEADPTEERPPEQGSQHHWHLGPGHPPWVAHSVHCGMFSSIPMASTEPVHLLPTTPVITGSDS